MTPPVTPQRSLKRSVSDSVALSSPLSNELDLDEMDMDTDETDEAGLSWDALEPEEYTGVYRMHGFEEFGRGAWSAVYVASRLQKPSEADILTPPTSPLAKSTPAAGSAQLLAIKAPLRRDAHSVLYDEARTLTFLSRSPQSRNRLVPFRGYQSAEHRLILSALPTTLQNHIIESAKAMKVNFSTRTMFNPVVGTPQVWLSLARSLITGLAWLHSMDVVHGDIKPQNILLEPTATTSDSTFAFNPLYADFSSSHHTSTIPAPQLSALTPDYASPALLKSMVATKESDVYGLATTLLFAAVGTPLYPGGEMVRLMMCQAGQPVQAARNGDQGSRVRKGGPVVRVVEGALKGVSAEEWLQLVDEVEASL